MRSHCNSISNIKRVCTLMTPGNPYAIEKRTAQMMIDDADDDTVSVVSTHDGDTNGGASGKRAKFPMAGGSFWTTMRSTKLVDACEEMQAYVDNKSWQDITGENVIEDTLKEFEDARETLLHLTMKAVTVIVDTDRVRNHSRGLK